MTTQTPVSTAGTGPMVVRNAALTITTLPRRQATAVEPPIMHAWSIGTTRIAQERPITRRKEECPPEVYIG
jgi:hypothetical protein